ncbi:MAG TPA: ABC transporter ATP-binding protein [Xanthobacteraceae bacterium]|nr:ABC transporter ATP-binding protein [Xanthobacteraceae bacterium]
MTEIKSGTGSAPASTTTASVVTLNGVAKRFANGTLALDQLDLAVHGGEFVSLLGPSGCGKSTVLRLIAGLTEPTSGSISWSGIPLLAFPGSPSPALARLRGRARWRSRNKPEVGFVFQEPTLMPWATVLRNVMLPLELAGVGHRLATQRATEALERVGLASFRDAYPRELSGGMRMRVSIARALVTDPPLLLMDEPFAALDEITRFKLNNDLLELWRAVGPTVIFVTHSVFESVYLSSRIIVMTPRPGRVFTELAVDAPYPRDESFRTSAEYGRHCRIASQALSRAMAEDRERQM